MTKKNNGNSKIASIDSGLIAHECHSIEALNEYYAVNGWHADYRQIESGHLRVQLSALKIGHIELYRERANRRLWSSVKSADHSYTSITALSNDRFLLCGRIVGRDDLILIPPGNQLDIVRSAGTDTLTIHIPADRIGDYDTAFGGVDSIVDITHMTLKRAPNMNVDMFRRKVLAILTKQSAAATDSDMDRTLMIALTDMLQGVKSICNGHDPYARLEKHRVLLRARHYIKRHLSEDIRITDLCDYCGVSLSTLERTFSRALNISPKNFLLIMRLQDVRCKIIDSRESSFTIAEMAMNCGFGHMGRFSHYYRNHFGRLPSEDRDLGADMHRMDWAH